MRDEIIENIKILADDWYYLIPKNMNKKNN